MAYIMHIYSSKEENEVEGFEVSEIVHDIDHTTSLTGQAGKLTFTLEKDLKNELSINVGSLVKFWNLDSLTKKKTPIFMGYVFTISVNNEDNYRIVAYDQTRYLQNHTMFVLEEDKMDLIEVFEHFCKTYKLNYNEEFKWKTVGDLLKITKNVFPDNSVFDILQYCMSDADTRYVSTKVKMNGISFPFQKFYIKDNFGKLELREIAYDYVYDEYGAEKNDALIIGDESLLTTYDYSVDIDKDTYNEIIFTYNEKSKSSSKSNKQVDKKRVVAVIQAGTEIKDTKTNLDGTTIGEDTIPKWGILSKLVEVNDISDKDMLGLYYKDVLELSNNPTHSMRLSAIGYDGIIAGSSFVLKLDKLKINYPVYVVSATHHYNADIHTMDLEVNTNTEIEVFK